MPSYFLSHLDDPTLLAALAHEVGALCKRTAGYLAQERMRFDPSHIESKGLNDLVSYVDREAEKQAIAGLQALLPEARFVTEEGTLSKSDGRTDPGAGTYWIIDPLDGTTNFIHDLGVYAVSVALLHEGELVLGCVADPVRDELFLAWHGGGAYRNGQRIRVSQAARFEDSLLATGFPYQKFDKMAAYLDIIEVMMHTSHGLRRMGSAAIDLAWTACGRFDGFFEYNLKAWDCAGGIVLVREAGGIVTDFEGGGNCLFGGELIASGPLHGAMLGLISEKWGNAALPGSTHG